MSNPLKIVTYSRCSTSHHDQNPDVQVQEMRRYCQARGWEIAHEIIDHGFSGSTDNRPGLKKLFALVKGRDVDAVITLKLDRLFRSLKHLVTVLDDFQTLGVTFIATKDNVDWTTPSGRLFTSILGSLAEFEKALLRERTVMGLDHARRMGKVLGRPKIRNDQEIGRLRGLGLSYSQIQSELGITSSAVWRSLKGGSKTSSKPSLDAIPTSPPKTFVSDKAD